MFHIWQTIRRHFSLRQVKLCIGQRKYKQTFTTQGDRSTKRVNSRSLTKLLFRILQNSRNNVGFLFPEPSKYCGSSFMIDTDFCTVVFSLVFLLEEATSSSRPSSPIRALPSSTLFNVCYAG